MRPLNTGVAHDAPSCTHERRMREESAHVELGLRHVATGEPSRSREEPEQGHDRREDREQ